MVMRSLFSGLNGLRAILYAILCRGLSACVVTCCYTTHASDTVDSLYVHCPESVFIRRGLVRYRLSNSTSDATFVIDSVSGEMRTVGAIDRERTKSYRLTVLAENVGYQLSSSADVIIRVVDVNDNPPTLLRPEMICVSRATSRGQTVGRLEATDVDQGLDARLKFRWIDLDEDIGTQLFHLSQDDGHVIAKADMRAFVGRHFRFRVTVEDLGVPARSAVGTVSIVFNDTCAVADRRHAATPRETDGDDWHSAAMVIIVSAFFGTALGFSIVAVYAFRQRQSRRRCVNLLGTVPLIAAFSDRVSTPHELARRFQVFPGDVESVSMQEKLQFVASDATTDVTMVN